MLILCYHKVGPAAAEGRRLNIEPDALQKQIRWLKKRGCSFICARDLDRAWPNRGVCLTFDDAYVSTLGHGVAVMQAEGVSGSIYAVPNLVGGQSEWDEDLAAPLADWTTLREAQAAGFEIGNHSLSHPNFRELTKDEQVAEIRLAQEKFAEHEIEPGSFCLPYGGLNSDTESAIQEAGMQIGLALGGRVASPMDSKRLLPRVVIAYSDGVPGLIYRAFIRARMKKRPSGAQN